MFLSLWLTNLDIMTSQSKLRGCGREEGGREGGGVGAEWVGFLLDCRLTATTNKLMSSAD